MNIPTTRRPLTALTPHPQNYNIHPKNQVAELAESLATFGQFKNIVCWTCPVNMTTDEGHELHEGLTYILAGHGLWLAAMEAGLNELEVKDYSGLSYEMALALLMADNAAPLGSEPDKEKLATLLRKTQSLLDNNPGLAEPFLGSGTTLIAAQQLGRRCYGVELQPKYGAVCLERFFNWTGLQPRRMHS